MTIHTFKLGDLQTNTYVVEKEGKAIIIDPADDASFITEELLRRRITPVGMYGTHGHFDHMLAVGELQLNFSIPFFLNEKDIFITKRVKKTAKYFHGYDPVFIPPQTITHLQNGLHSIDLFVFNILHIPGHTPGSVAFYFPNDQLLFVGDTLFAGSIGRVDASYSDKIAMRNSLNSLFQLPPETIVYPGHGELTSIGMEKKYKEEYAHLLSR